jgi:acyl-coenzyme A synthetase/AMP-(fatty) acid ligase
VNCNIAASLERSATALGDHPGLVEAASGKKLSFTQVSNRSDSYAHLLYEKGIRQGDRVMLMVKPSADFICLTFALFKIGAPVILIDPGMGYKNLLKCIKGVAPQVFIGIPKAHLFKTFFPKPFASVRHSLCCGGSFGVFGPDISKAANRDRGGFPICEVGDRDLAAIIFTTGSTGPPKGVRYEHGIFQAQLRLIHEHYGIGKGDVDQPAFPLFALFSTALGATAVIPDMDPTRPAQVDPASFVASIEKYGVTYSFGSPAIWNVIAKYCVTDDPRLDSLDKVLMAGAPVSGGLIERMQDVLQSSARIHTPYGATESLPIVSIEGHEITDSTWDLTRQGKGTCVGTPLPGIDIQIIPISDHAIPVLDTSTYLPSDAIGEIIVRGDVVTRAYENNDHENSLSKISDGGTFWHRMGDVGYKDTAGRLWFCGRRGHRVLSTVGGVACTLFTIPCEALFNNHPDVFRSALVGVPDGLGTQTPVIVLEPEKKRDISDSELLCDAQQIAAQNSLTKDIRYFLVHPEFPVDIRHNAKIFREKLSVWAESQLKAVL